MLLSPFTPLMFDNHKHDGIDSNYIQTFASSDHIMIQVLGEEDWSGVAQIYSEPEHEMIWQIEWSTWKINESSYLRFAEIRLDPGYYSVEITGVGLCKPFHVTDDERILANTTLIQYTMNSNRHRRDAVFIIDGMQRYFEIRVPGGFKDSNWTFGMNGEQFVTDEEDIVQLYGRESTQKKFTLGTSSGCQIWFAEMLNRILSCTYVYFDGKRYARKENATPEMTVLQEGLNSFIFMQTVQAVNTYRGEVREQQIILRRATSDDFLFAKQNINRVL